MNWRFSLQFISVGLRGVHILSSWVDFGGKVRIGV